MPNYNLVANTQFKARSFDDILRPFVDYTKAYREQEDAIAELSTKADVWAGLANEQTDPIAYAQYANYANALKEQASLMADRGLNPSSRQEMLNLKRRYASEIVPIEQAYAAKKAQTEEQRKALLQNPTLMLSRRADATSLDDYMKDPNLGYDSYSGALLTQQVSTAASAVAKELRDYGRGKPLNEYTKTWLQNHGYKASEVAFAINHPDDPKASHILNTIVNNVMNDSGMANWADTKTMDQAYEYARQGLWQAIGQTQIGTYNDIDAINRARGRGDTPTDKNTKFDYRNVRTPEDIKEASDFANEWEKYKKYFRKGDDGKWELTEEGKKQKLTHEFNPHANSIVGKESAYKGRTDFGEFLDTYGLGNAYAGKLDDEMSSKLEDLTSRSENRYDTNTATEYLRGIEPSLHDNVISVINRNRDSDGNIKNYKRVKKGNSYEFVRGEDVSLKDLKSSDISSATAVYGEHGNFLEIQLKDGNTLEVPIQNYSSRWAADLNGNVGTIKGLKKMQQEGKTHYQLPSGEIRPIVDLLNEEIDNMGENFISSLGLSKAEPIKTTVDDYYLPVY